MSTNQKSYNSSEGRFNSSINDHIYNQYIQKQKSYDKFTYPNPEIKKPQRVYKYNDRIPKVNDYYCKPNGIADHINSNHERDRDYIIVDVDGYGRSRNNNYSINKSHSDINKFDFNNKYAYPNNNFRDGYNYGHKEMPSGEV
ncbi:hypothetical protein AYI70_g10837 [Smittium culicis]|uniref:Uncharacterized protein n=1 Tax=Smittium culicis TaxID=133412 RepID=A0A1R1X4R2_9FUNG|nr:hypothetical protein AYI70_g10837 [Smittium culicis]